MVRILAAFVSTLWAEVALFQTALSGELVDHTHHSVAKG
jgi:hypothetical protein